MLVWQSVSEKAQVTQWRNTWKTQTSLMEMIRINHRAVFIKSSAHQKQQRHEPQLPDRSAQNTRFHVICAKITCNTQQLNEPHESCCHSVSVCVYDFMCVCVTPVLVLTGSSEKVLLAFRWRWTGWARLKVAGDNLSLFHSLLVHSLSNLPSVFVFGHTHMWEWFPQCSCC